MLSRLGTGARAWIPTLRYACTQATSGEFVDPCSDPNNPKDLSLSQIKEAHERIKGKVVRTDCKRSYYFSKIAGCDVFLKMENKQRTGSFKDRAACNALMCLSEEERKKGVFVGSNGNYAEAMAYHGRKLGVPVTVVMPRYISLSIISLCQDFGANVVVEGKDHSEVRAAAFKLAKEKGGKYIDGHDNIDVIAGAGTIGLEILEQVKDVDFVLVPVGAAGLYAGISVAIKQTSPKTKIIGIESEATQALSAALKEGRPVNIKRRPSLASSLAVSAVGHNSFHIAKGNVDKTVAVRDSELSLAILRMLEREKILVEGAGAMGPASLLAGSVEGVSGKKVVCVLSGGNIDSTIVGPSIEKGLVSDHRLVMFEVLLPDRSGSICDLFELAARTGASVKHTAVEHVFHRFGMFAGKCKVIVETRGLDHCVELKEALSKRYGNNCEFFMKKEK
ncbi:hypothetical protein Aduo_014589 [Ancylostoma duodenale]